MNEWISLVFIHLSPCLLLLASLICLPISYTCTCTGNYKTSITAETSSRIIKERSRWRSGWMVTPTQYYNSNLIMEQITLYSLKSEGTLRLWWQVTAFIIMQGHLPSTIFFKYLPSLHVFVGQYTLLAITTARIYFQGGASSLLTPEQEKKLRQNTPCKFRQAGWHFSGIWECRHWHSDHS